MRRKGNRLVGYHLRRSECLCLLCTGEALVASNAREFPLSNGLPNGLFPAVVWLCWVPRGAWLLPADRVC